MYTYVYNMSHHQSWGVTEIGLWNPPWRQHLGKWHLPKVDTP